MRRAERIGNEPDAVALRPRERLDERSLLIALIVAGNRSRFDDVDSSPDPHRRLGWRIGRSAPRHLRVRVESADLDEERRTGDLDVLVGNEERLGYRVDLVVVGVGRVDDRQLPLSRALDVVDGLAFLDRQLCLDLEEAGDELADEEDDEPQVHDPESELAEAEVQPLQLRRDRFSSRT